MSANPAFDSSRASTADGLPETGAAASERLRVVSEDVAETWAEIQQLATEIAGLSETDIPPSEFFAEFLQRVVGALASVGGVVWLADADGTPRPAAQINLDAALTVDAQQGHQRTLSTAMSSDGPQSIPPKFSGADPGWQNPTEHLLILIPLKVDGRVLGLVEVFQRPNRGPATERGYRRFLVQMCQMANSYLKSHSLRQLSDRHEWACQLETFISGVHQTLDVRPTAFAVVNDACRVLSCDRVSLALGTGRHCRVMTVSGLDSVDRRAEQIRRMKRLTARVVSAGEAIWLGSGEEELSPQIESEWSRYVDIAHVRRCGVVPLYQPTGDTSAVSEPFGALIIENLSDATADEQLERRSLQIAHHSAAALWNSLKHERLFLMPLWRVLGTLCDTLFGEYFSKTLLFVTLLVSSVVALCTIPSDFSVPVKGKLQPMVRRTIFAGENGVIVQVPVEHGVDVQRGQILVQMRNTDLEVEIASLVGKQTTTREQILALQRALLDNPHLDVGQQNRLSGELLQLRQVDESIQRQLALVRQKEQQLIVRSDRAGQVVTWQVRDRLLHRPVQKGQALMAVVDPAQHWELELYVPERHFGHVSQAVANNSEPPVTFVLSSDAKQQYQGTLVEIDRVALAREEYGNTVRVRVAIDKSELPELRCDATVMARVQCGQRAIGYAWFHDLIDTIHAKILFWL